MADTYLAKYTGIVKDNQDAQKLGQLKLSVPAVFPPDETLLARPALPFGFFFVPENEAKVWVEFEGGDPGLPLWTGVQYVDGEWAAEAQADPPAKRAIRTVAAHLLLFDDTSGQESVTIHEGAAGHVIVLDKDGIKIEDGAAGHVIVLDSNGIKIAQGGSTPTIAVSSSGIVVDAGSGNVELKGAQVKLTATSGATVDGGGGQTAVKGATVSLNGGVLPVIRLTDQGIGNMGAPVPIVVGPGALTVSA